MDLAKDPNTRGPFGKVHDLIVPYLYQGRGLIVYRPAGGAGQHKCRRLRGLLISSFNGKPQALPLDFAYACGSPLNENDQ